MFRVALARIGATIGTIVLWVYAIADFLFDWIGRSTVDDDAAPLVNEKLPGMGRMALHNAIVGAGRVALYS